MLRVPEGRGGAPRTGTPLAANRPEAPPMKRHSPGMGRVRPVLVAEMGPQRGAGTSAASNSRLVAARAGTMARPPPVAATASSRGAVGGVAAGPQASRGDVAASVDRGAAACRGEGAVDGVTAGPPASCSGETDSVGGSAAACRGEGVADGVARFLADVAQLRPRSG